MPSSLPLAALGPVGAFPTRLGPFVLRAELGAGSAGAVYLADQQWPARRVALKLLWNGLAGPEDRCRFDLETAALAKLGHPGIAHLYEAGTVRIGAVEHAFLAMEFVDGLPLRQWQRTHAPDLATRGRCLVDVCEAIEAAHRQGVVHRDLKPDNILVETAGKKPRPRVLDFGVAKLLAAEPAPADDDALVGTLNYMSPEQALRAPDADGRADVYSLGAVAHELLTGELPRRLGGLSWAQARERLTAAGALPPSAARAALPTDLQLILAKALARDPAQRYATPGALAADLTGWLERRPVAARPATWTYRLWCFARRQRLAFVSLTLTASALLVAAGAGWLAFASTRSELEQALATSRFTVERIVGRLSTLAGTSEVRAETLGHLLPQVENCVRLRPDDVPALRCKEQVLRYLGDIEIERANWSKATDLRHAAEATSRALVQLCPDDDELRADWATALVRVGDAVRGAGRHPHAEGAYRQAHEVFAALAAAHPEDARHVDDLAWSCDRLAFFAVEHRDFAAAEAMLGQRRALLDQLAWLRPHSLTNLAGERELHSLWSHLEGSRGNHVARQQHLRAAVPLAREWLRRSPNDHQAIITFTNTVYSYVAYEPTPVSDAEARPLVLEALASVERMLVQEPRHALGNDLARYLRGKAQALGR